MDEKSIKGYRNGRQSRWDGDKYYISSTKGPGN
jgi:hypothetical protein